MVFRHGNTAPLQNYDTNIPPYTPQSRLRGVARETSGGTTCSAVTGLSSVLREKKLVQVQAFSLILRIYDQNRFKAGLPIIHGM